MLLMLLKGKIRDHAHEPHKQLSLGGLLNNNFGDEHENVTGKMLFLMNAMILRLLLLARKMCINCPGIN